MAEVTFSSDILLIRRNALRGFSGLPIPKQAVSIRIDFATDVLNWCHFPADQCEHLDMDQRGPIYLDHHATTPVDPRVVAVAVHAMTIAFGNANSVEHIFGEIAAGLIAQACQEVADLVGSDPDGVTFTTGSTEGISLAVRHAVATRRRKDEPLRIALSKVEHRAALDAVAAAERAGEATIQWLAVDGKARLDLDALHAACKRGVDLVCVMSANNEVGTIYPIADVVRIARDADARTLIDATQSVGRLPIAADALGVTYLTVSAHKIYGPKGVGALVTCPALRIRSGRGAVRSVGEGTPNVPGIAGMGEACRLRRLEMTVDEPRIARQRDRLEALLRDYIDGMVVNGDQDSRLSHNLHVSVPGVPNDAVVARLHRRVAISTGAACSSGAQEPSHVLRAMGLPQALQESALRIGLGKFTTDDDIDQAAMELAGVVRATREALTSA